MKEKWLTLEYKDFYTQIIFYSCSKKNISFQNEEKKGMLLFVQGGKEKMEIEICGWILSNRMILEPHMYTVKYLWIMI